VVVFLLMPFSTSQAKIVCAISKMDNNLHPKSCEKGRFKATKFPNMILRLIHQMWDKMVNMIIINKENKIVTTFEGAQTNVESSLVIKASKKQKRR